MQPEEPQQQQPQPLQQPQQPLNSSKPPIYRQYWPFAVIFLLVPAGVIIAIALISTGEIYRGKDGVWNPISMRERITLIIVGFVLQMFSIIQYMNR